MTFKKCATSLLDVLTHTVLILGVFWGLARYLGGGYAVSFLAVLCVCGCIGMILKLINIKEKQDD